MTLTLVYDDESSCTSTSTSGSGRRRHFFFQKVIVSRKDDNDADSVKLVKWMNKPVAAMGNDKKLNRWRPVVVHTRTHTEVEASDIFQFLIKLTPDPSLFNSDADLNSHQIDAINVDAIAKMKPNFKAVFWQGYRQTANLTILSASEPFRSTTGWATWPYPLAGCKANRN